MWCGKCQSEVAAEVSPDNQRVFCASCGALLSTIDVPPPRPGTDKVSDRTKDARELLQRWSSGKIIDPFGPAIRSPAVTNSLTSRAEAVPPPNAEAEHSDAPIAGDSATSIVAPTENRSQVPSPLSATASSPSDSPVHWNGLPAFSVGHSDAINLLGDGIASATPNPFAAIGEAVRPVIAPSPSPFGGSGEPSTRVAPLSTNPPIAVVSSPNAFRLDAAHPADHFANSTKITSAPRTDSAGPFASIEPPAAATRESRRAMSWFPTWDPAVWRTEPGSSCGWSSLAGQFLAYAGVLGMTAGASMVVWSHFGGPANYAPTGWLLATAGQMLLFFGVVTLVSGGLEQTTEQVNKRIEQLGDHIIRIEQAAREMSLRGNSIPPAHFGHDPDAAAPQRSAASGYERSVVEE